MPQVKPSPKFRKWLSDSIEESGLSKREVARRMAAGHRDGVTAETIDTGRRTINKILSGDLQPTQPTRDLIAAALKRDDAPSIDDEEEEPDLQETLRDLRQLAIEQARLQRQVKRVLQAADS